MKAMRLATPLPQQPTVEIVQREIRDVLVQHLDYRLCPVGGKQLAQLAGALIQFSDHVPGLRPHIQTPYVHIQSYYDAVVGRAQATGNPLTFRDQLEISLLQNDGDLPNSLWQLFLASRFYARRRDGHSLADAPMLSSDEKLSQMVTWQQSLAACNPYDREGYQDAAGDTYYTWTHALAKVGFCALPDRPNGLTAATARIFESGTRIMQAFVNRFYPEGGGATARDHNLAAAYGNAIGQVCVETLLNPIANKPTDAVL